MPFFNIKIVISFYHRIGIKLQQLNLSTDFSEFRAEHSVSETIKLVANWIGTIE